MLQTTECILSSYKITLLLFAGRWVLLEIIILSELREFQKGRCGTFSLIYGSYFLYRYRKSFMHLWYESINKSFLGKKKERLKGNLRRQGRRVCGVNIFKIHYISTLKCPHKTQDCIQWKWANENIILKYKIKQSKHKKGRK